MVKTLNAKDKAEIEQVVSEAEKRTAAELCVVVARAADDHAFAALCCGLVAGSVLATLAHLKNPLWHFTTLLWLQLLIALAFVAVPFFRHGCVSLLPRRHIDRNAVQSAAGEYMRMRENLPAGAPFVLLYFSQLERYMHIYASDKVAALIPVAEWQEIVQALAGAQRSRGLKEAIMEAVARAGDKLASHFPASDAAHRHEDLVIR